MRYTDDDCLKALQTVANKLGKSPSWRDYLDSDQSPSGKVIRERFGGWNEAKMAAGLETMEDGFQWRDGNYFAPTLTEDNDGYLRFWIDGKVYPLHRLIAIAEYGVEKVSGNVVHHKNHVILDNRPENLEPMSLEDHIRRHHSNESH